MVMPARHCAFSDISGMPYKRNQIEEAIARIVAPDSAELPSELRTRIKRLLELDRSLGRKLRSKDAEQANFLFFSEEAPGTGADILFSEYEAFALLNGLRIMGGAILRRVCPDLEREHARGSSCKIRTSYSIGKRYVQRPALATSRSPTPIRCFLHWFRRRSTRLTKRERLDFPLCAGGM